MTAACDKSLHGKIWNFAGENFKNDGNEDSSKERRACTGCSPDVRLCGESVQRTLRTAGEPDAARASGRRNNPHLFGRRPCGPRGEPGIQDGRTDCPDSRGGG